MDSNITRQRGEPKMSSRPISCFTVLIIATFLAASAFAQAKPPAQDTGLTSYVEFGGTTNSAGQVYELDSNIGYTFPEYFGMDLGVPVYFERIQLDDGRHIRQRR